MSEPNLEAALQARQPVKRSKLPLFIVLGLTAWIIILLVPGSRGGSYVVVRFMAFLIEFLEDNWDIGVAIGVGAFLARVAGAFTIEIPEARGVDVKPKVKAVWYRPGSLRIVGGMAIWKGLGGQSYGCSDRYLTRRTLLGWSITQEVQLTDTTGLVHVYETAKVEASRSLALQNKVRDLQEEKAALRLELAKERALRVQN